MKKIDEKYKLKELSFKDFCEQIVNILRLVGEFKWIIVLCVVLSFFCTTLSVIGPKFMALATNDLFYGLGAASKYSHKMNLNQFIFHLSITLVIYIGNTIFSLLNSMLGVQATQKACYRLRQRISKKISTVQIKYLEGEKRGDVISRLTNDVDIIASNFTSTFVSFITSTTLLIGSLAMMLWMNWFLTLIVVIAVPTTAFISSRIIKKTQKYYVAQQQLLGELNGVVEETMSGLQIIHIFNRQDKAKKSFSDLNDEYFDLAFRRVIVSLLISPIVSLASQLSNIIVIIIGAWLSIIGQFSVGGIQAFLQYMGNFSNPFNSIAGLFDSVQKMSAATDRIFEFLNYEDEDDTSIQPEDKLAIVKDRQGNVPVVTFDHVSFSYNKHDIVIHDFNLDVYAGQTIAIVGPTGAGKTTLVKLLMRFYDCCGGSIRLNGKDIRMIKFSELRKNIAMVLQDIWLFQGPIKDNIVYGRLDATQEEIEEAAEIGCCADFIQKLPGKYDFEISEYSRNLSVGQKQLLSISRSILADRDILILDEATSSVDTMTEKKLYSAFDHLIKTKTSFVVAHRLSTIMNADKILVINNGEIVESGTHKELLALNGFYTELYNAQFEN